MSQNNTGSTLILALIILSVLLATASVFGVTALSNFRQARNINQSVASYYLADIGVERGVYYFRQHSIIIDKCAPDSVADNCDLQIEAEDKGDIGFLKKDTSVQLDIYAPGISAPDIQFLKVTWDDLEVLPKPRVEISWVGWTGVSFSDPFKTSPPLLDPTGGTLVDLHNYEFYRVRVKALIANVYNLQVTAWDSAVTQRQNIPGIFEAKAVGSYGNTKQASAITASHFSPLSGLYDYVLFSEEEINKTYCGDGIKKGSEECDDGSLCGDGSTDCTADAAVCGGTSCLPRNNDGCSAACEIEP